MREILFQFKINACYGTVKVVCEGRFFERLGDAMGAAQKVVLEQTASALGGAAVLHKWYYSFIAKTKKTIKTLCDEL